jgi:23S rRNA pseudouridine1911/1915/1917 synthase
VEHAARYDFEILAEGPQWLVVHKPAPLQIHPGSLHGAPTLWHGLKELLIYELANGGQVSIVNRLDRETSGAVLVATSAAMARALGMAMQERRIHKTYQALVHGWPTWQELDFHGPILRQGEVRPSVIWVRQCVDAAGAACQTLLRCLSRVQHPSLGPLSLIEARPVTGRMHQIRVHLSHLGLPIVGDKIYGLNEACYLEFIQTGWTDSLQRQLGLSRQALHSCRLRVDDDALRGTWDCPLPAELQSLISESSLATDLPAPECASSVPPPPP